MKYLQDLIRERGEVLPGDILKVDSFLNHQIDVNAMNEIGKEFARLFKEKKVDKILTIETSGLAIAQATSLHMHNQPVVYAKKTEHKNITFDCYMCSEISYTKGNEYIVKVFKDYLSKDENILIIDDFLANGEALNALLTICKQAQANVVGVGICIAKMYQPGYERIKKEYEDIEVLAKIKSMSTDGTIEFEEND